MKVGAILAITLMTTVATCGEVPRLFQSLSASNRQLRPEVVWSRHFHPLGDTRFERRLRLDELIPVSREEFVSWSGRRLSGERLADPLADAWWTIRTGAVQRADQTHDLLLINLHTQFLEPKKKESAGHFCFGIRNRGGDANGDLVFDFRAPWYLDSSPTIPDALNFDNSLQIRAFSANLYDWLYTQTSIRGCYVKIWFVPISVEQRTLLEGIADVDSIHAGGPFKPARKNCASLGLLFLDRLSPADLPLMGGATLLADFPPRSAELAIERFAGDQESVPFLKLPGRTRASGREPTAKSEIHPAQPSRGTSAEFRALAELR